MPRFSTWILASTLLASSACGDGAAPGQGPYAADAGPADAGLDAGSSSVSPAREDAGPSPDAAPSAPLDAAGPAPADAAADGAAPDSGVKDPGDAGDGDYTLSQFPIQRELTDLGAPKGKSFRFSMDSTKSVIFDGRDPTLVASKPRNLTRQIDVYVPASYRDGTPAPVLILQDGPGPLNLVSRALDNLTITEDESRRIPAFIAIGVQNGGSDAQGSERGLEYDTLSDRYARFIDQEVLPAVLADASVKAAFPKLAFTADPEGRAAFGCSSGAAAAFTMAWFRPDLFRRVISYSGTFVAQQENGQPEAKVYPLGAWEYHSSKQLIASTRPNLPVRVFLNVNELDNGYNASESGHHNWVMANQRMAAALGERGYHYRYVFAKGLGHCDGKAQQATLADALVWVWAGYPH